MSLGLIRREPAVGARGKLLVRFGIALTVTGLVGVVLAGGLPALGRALLLIAPLVVVIVLLGVLLRTTLPRDARQVGPHLLWPLVLPMSDAVHAGTIDVLPIGVKDISGTEITYNIRGRLARTTPVMGDIVEVYGRTGRRGDVTVRSLIIMCSGETITVRTPLRCTVARWTSAAIIGCWAIAALVACWQILSTI